MSLEAMQLQTYQQKAATPTPASKVLQRKCACGNHTVVGGECAECRKKQLQRKAVDRREATAVPPIVHEVLRSPGQPLDKAMRDFMEPKFGHDFSSIQISAPVQTLPASLSITTPKDVFEQSAETTAYRILETPSRHFDMHHDFSHVRIHTDTKAAESARTINALAYTVGNNIVFGAGQYSPSTFGGKHLLAHELTHVVQQRNGVGVSLQRQGAPTSCSLEVCWVPIKAYGLGKAGQVHGVLNLTSGSTVHHIEVDPSQHMPRGIWHSHVVDNSGAKTSANCQTLTATCAELNKIESAAKNYESKDVIYDPLTIRGPNSNSFIEWTLDNAGINTTLVKVPFGATGWSYFQSNTAQRTDPPHVMRTDPGKTPAPAPKSATGGSCTKAYAKQTRAAGYLDLIRAAESNLSAAGIIDVKDQIKILRGLYYGTPWSRDFGKEQSLSRVTGFQTFTVSGVKYPRDPISILDCGLYEALQRSQDITAHSVTLDVGHLLIGLDAREATVAGVFTPSFPFPGFGGSGLEIVTWLGDLGGGAASLARDRVQKSATQSASTKFTGVDYGGSSNLEGDIAAFLVARGSATTVVPPIVPPGKGIADLLEAYLEPATTGGSADWKSRAQMFLSMYGGTFNALGTLTNKAKVIDIFADQIESFACAYIMQRYMGTVSDTDFLAIANNVPPCSNEVAEAFVHALEDAMTSGGRIEAKRFPRPLPAATRGCLTATATIRAKQLAERLWKAP
jgi:hypothetical protein